MIGQQRTLITKDVARRPDEDFVHNRDNKVNVDAHEAKTNASAGPSQKNTILDSVLVEAKQKATTAMCFAIGEALGVQFEDAESEKLLMKNLDECWTDPTTIVQRGYMSFACDTLKKVLGNITLSNSQTAERLCASLCKRLFPEFDDMFQRCESTPGGLIYVFLQPSLLGASVDSMMDGQNVLTFDKDSEDDMKSLSVGQVGDGASASLHGDGLDLRDGRSPTDEATHGDGMDGPYALMRPVNIESYGPQTSLAYFFHALDQPAYQDRHCECRSRGYNTFAYTRGNDGCSFELAVQPQSLFEQPGEYNTLAAQQVIPEKRKFAPLPEGFVESDVVTAVIKQTMRGVGDIREEPVQFAKLGMHFIKIHAEGEGGVGTPVPEGRHQDGFDFVSITVLERRGIEGGLNIFAESQTGAPFLSALVQPGHGYVIDDRKLWHDVKPIQATGSGGSRCVLVVTVTVQDERQELFNAVRA